jgi:hypothetical protein
MAPQDEGCVNSRTSTLHFSTDAAAERRALVNANEK